VGQGQPGCSFVSTGQLADVAGIVQGSPRYDCRLWMETIMQELYLKLVTAASLLMSEWNLQGKKLLNIFLPRTKLSFSVIILKLYNYSKAAHFLTYSWLTTAKNVLLVTLLQCFGSGSGSASTSGQALTSNAGSGSAMKLMLIRNTTLLYRF